MIAVQMAKRVFNAEVTGVAGPGQKDFLSDLGADRVLDYTTDNVLESNEAYDVILDLATTLKYADIAHLLSKTGRFVPADPMKNEADFAEGSEAARKTGYLLVSKGNRADLDTLRQWIDDGLIETRIDSKFDMHEIDAALERLAVRNKIGRIVIKVANA